MLYDACNIRDEKESVYKTGGPKDLWKKKPRKWNVLLLRAIYFYYSDKK